MRSLVGLAVDATNHRVVGIAQKMGGSIMRIVQQNSPPTAATMADNLMADGASDLDGGSSTATMIVVEEEEFIAPRDWTCGADSLHDNDDGSALDATADASSGSNVHLFDTHPIERSSSLFDRDANDNSDRKNAPLFDRRRLDGKNSGKSHGGHGDDHHHDAHDHDGHTHHTHSTNNKMLRCLSSKNLSKLLKNTLGEVDIITEKRQKLQDASKKWKR